MKVRHPWLIHLLALVGAAAVRLWMATVRYRFAGPAHPADPRVARYIYAFWHESMLVPAGLRTRARVLISRHADGELIAQVCRRLGFLPVRGSTTRGGAAGLLALTNPGEAPAHVAVTPDGPRGPRRRAQVGAVALASLTGLPVVGCGVGYSRAWRARSWDRFAVPRPWSAVCCVMTPPLRVPAGLDRDGLERYRRLLEEHLLHATEAAERWAAGGPPPAADAAAGSRACA
jgi:lysophospholipid acyltransferase (LPLAT)-like uncharacterized protein